MYERRERVKKAIREKISEFILREIGGNSIISVTRVLLTKDLKGAKVYISSLGEKEKSLEILKKQTSPIRAYLAKKINLRYTPTISFFIDE